VPAAPRTALQIERSAMTEAPVGGVTACPPSVETYGPHKLIQLAAQCWPGMLKVPHFSPHQAYNAALRDSLFATFAVSAPSAHFQAYQPIPLYFM